MIQEIAPKKLMNHYYPAALAPDSKICVFRDADILCLHEGHTLTLPDARQLEGALAETVYLLSIDDQPYFLGRLKDGAALPAGYGFERVREHRRLRPKETVYAEMTAWHLYVWYRDNRFCGRCGHPTVHDERLRMLKCPDCGNMIFPKICPAVIVGVVDGDRILLTRYAGRAYKSYALIAGFTEIGETAEETVAREVMEETGVRVKNLRYWHTQPWGMDTDLLLGFFAELDGADKITMDREELSSAGWYRRSELDIPADDVSLTNDMIRAFIEDRVPDFSEDGE